MSYIVSLGSISLFVIVSSISFSIPLFVLTLIVLLLFLQLLLIPRLHFLRLCLFHPHVRERLLSCCRCRLYWFSSQNHSHGTHFQKFGILLLNILFFDGTYCIFHLAYREAYPHPTPSDVFWSEYFVLFPIFHMYILHATEYFFTIC